MKILAIDPGFERLGIAVIEKKNHEREKLLFSSCFKTSAKLPFEKRIHNLGERTEKIIAAYRPEHLAIETLFFNSNQKTAMRVAEVRGIMIYLAEKHALAVYEYTPLQIKIAIAGSGRADKKQVAAMVSKLILIESATQKIDDEIDAVAVGLTHAASVGVVEKWGL